MWTHAEHNLITRNNLQPNQGPPKQAAYCGLYRSSQLIARKQRRPDPCVRDSVNEAADAW